MSADVPRLARLLFASVVLSWAGAMISASLGGIVVYQLTGDVALAGVPYVLINLGSAVAAYPAGHLMDRFGRRPVLVAGHLTNTLAFFLGLIAIHQRAIALFFAAYLVAAVGTGATYLTRLAAADLFPRERRGRGLSLVVFGAVFGVVLGTPLVLLAEQLGPAFAVPYTLVAWGLVSALSLASAAILTFLRPDPRTVAMGLQPSATPAREAPVVAIQWRPFLLAGAALIVAQASMISVMAAVPVHLHLMGSGAAIVALTMTAHIIGMFAFSPLIGVLADLWGRRPLLFVSGVLLSAASLTLIFAPLGHLISISLFVVGVGWSFAFISSSTIIADATGAAHRGRATAAVDALTAVFAATAAAISGWALAHGGMELIGQISLGLNVLVLLAAFASGLGKIATPRASRVPSPTEPS